MNPFQQQVRLYLVEFALERAYKTARDKKVKTLYKLALNQINRLDKLQLEAWNLNY